MGKETNEMGKQILEEIIKNSTFLDFKKSTQRIIHYILNDKIAIRVCARNRVGQIECKDSITDKKMILNSLLKCVMN